VTSIRDRLRARFRADEDVDLVGEHPLRERSGGDTGDDVRNAQSIDQSPVAPPPESHVPEAARSFDPWGTRTSWDDPGSTRRWVEGFLDSPRQHG
jgi:hypothetical protein